LSLVAELMSLEKDKEHLRINLDRAEEEVRIAGPLLLSTFSSFWINMDGMTDLAWCKP